MSDYESETESIVPIDYPVLELPRDVTARIFFWCIPSEIEDSPLAYTDIAPVLLGRVCSKWRQIALETPILWTTLWVVGHSNRDPKLDAIAVREYAARSGALPLNLKAYFHASTDDWREDKRYADGLSELVEQIRLCAHRCQVLDLCFPDLTLVGPIVDAMHKNGSAWLEELKVETDRLPGSAVLPPQVTRVPSPSQLRVLEFKTRTPQVPYLCPPLEHTAPRLRNISISQLMGWDEFQTWIMACPELEEACFEVIADSSRASIEENKSPFVSLEKLVHLELHIHCPVNNETKYLPLDRLRLPSLETLELRFGDEDATMDNSNTLQNLKALLKQSHPPLKNLLFRNVFAPLGSIVSILENVPQLESLDADWSTVNNELLRVLSVSSSPPTGSGPVLLPELRVFQVDDYICDSPDIMVAFIRSRWDSSRIIEEEHHGVVEAGDDEYLPPPERQFMEVCINSSCHTGLAENDDVIRCIAEGLSFNLLSPGPSSVSNWRDKIWHLLTYCITQLAG